MDWALRTFNKPIAGMDMDGYEKRLEVGFSAAVAGRSTACDDGRSV